MMKKKRGGWRKKNGNERTVSFKVSEDLIAAADQIAEQEEVPRTAVLRWALKVGLPVVAKSFHREDA